VLTDEDDNDDEDDADEVIEDVVDLDALLDPEILTEPVALLVLVGVASSPSSVGVPVTVT